MHADVEVQDRPSCSTDKSDLDVPAKKMRLEGSTTLVRAIYIGPIMLLIFVELLTGFHTKCIFIA